MQWQMKFAQMRSDANVSDEAGPVADGCEMGLLVVAMDQRTEKHGFRRVSMENSSRVCRYY